MTFFSESPLNTNTRIIWTIWLVPFVSVLTGFHCTSISGSTDILFCNTSFSNYIKSDLIKAFLKSRFSHSSDASTLKRHISDMDSCICCHSDALAADPIVCSTTWPCPSRSDACLPILVDQTAATEKVSYQPSTLYF